MPRAPVHVGKFFCPSRSPAGESPVVSNSKTEKVGTTMIIVIKAGVDAVFVII